MMSNHALQRSQQRCIPPVVHQWLTVYGEEYFDGHGGIRVFFSSKSKRKMEQELGRHFVRENQKYLKAYRVESSSDGTIITCGWKSGRLKA